MNHLIISFLLRNIKYLYIPQTQKNFVKHKKNGQNTRHSSLEIYSSESYDHESIRDENNDHESHKFSSRSAY